MLNRIVLFLVGIFFSLGAFAQAGKVPTEMRNGVNFHVHTVKKGQTAYGISRLYEISINQLYETNPEAEKGLKIGQKLYFKVKEEGLQTEITIIDSVSTNDVHVNDDLIIHTVEQGETMYSIARKYGVPASDVIAANKKGALSIGDKVKIPLQNVVKNDVVTPIIKEPVNPTASPGDSIVIHKVKKNETLYSLAKIYAVSIVSIKEANDGLTNGLKKGMKLRIVLKKKTTNTIENIVADTLQNETFDSLVTTISSMQDVYDVAVMIPFFFEENQARMKKCPPIGDCPIYSYTLKSLDYHHGVMMAIDSLKKAGMNINVHIYDTKNDTAEVNKILRKAEFSEIDLIIGPFYTQQIKIARKYAKSKNIQLICPIPVSNKALFNNPYVTKMVASTPTQIEFMAKEIALKYHDQNVILVRNQKSDKDEYYYRVFKKAFTEELKKYPNRYADSAKEAYLNSRGSRLSPVEAKMILDKNNIIVVPSQSVGHVTNFFTKLSSTTNSNPYRTYPLIVFGLESWSDFPTIGEKYKNKFNLHLVTSGYVDYNDKIVTDFIRNYRGTFSTDPSDYSFIGFDAAFVNLKGLFLYGTGFSNHYHQLDNKGFYTNSKFEKVDAQSGYENKNVIILRYKEYSVIKE